MFYHYSKQENPIIYYTEMYVHFVFVFSVRKQLNFASTFIFKGLHF